MHGQICLVSKIVFKQGGVLSPILFAIYTDGLLKLLQETCVSFHIGHQFTGTLAYADDISLLFQS